MNKNLVVGLGLAGVLLIVGIWAFMSSDRNGMGQPQPSPNSNASILGQEAKYKVSAEDVSYFQNMKGYFARPETPGEYPGVVMMHEWWGLNDNIKFMARELAGQGYLVLAVDLFGQVATTQDQARQLTGSLDKAKAVQNMQSATDFLREHNATKVASLGWCFGGGQSLQLALSGEKLAATVIYYGQLTDDKNQLRAIKWPVLGVFGEKDTSIPVGSVKAFQKSLNQLGVKNEIYIYPGVGHAFANPSGANYAPNETKDAWNKTLSFLNQTLL